MKSGQSPVFRLLQAIKSRLLPGMFDRPTREDHLQEQEVARRNLQHDQHQKKILDAFLKDKK